MTNYSLANLWHASPARLVTVLVAILAYLAVIGVKVPDPDQVASIFGLILVILAGGETIRSQVYSPATVDRLVAAGRLPKG